MEKENKCKMQRKYSFGTKILIPPSLRKIEDKKGMY
jgi:hypothetical protein